MPREQALYVVVRKDLGKSSSAVQAGHSVAEFMMDHPGVWNNGYLVYLAVPNLDELHKCMLTKYPDVSEFYEPDLNHQLTAFAVLGSLDSRLSDFASLPLL